MNSSAYYQLPSGENSPLAIPIVLAMGLPLAALLAVVYAYASLYIPIAGYISFILSGGFGLLLAVAVVFALKTGKVRGSLLAYLLCGLVGLFAFYISWVTWVYAFLQRADVDASFVGLLLVPSVLWEAIVAINENGAWTMFSATPTGALLWFVWGIEALFILVPVLFAGPAMVSYPFCERCAKWSEEHQGVVRLGFAPDGIRERAEARDFAGFSALGLVDASAPAQLRFDLHCCASCTELNALSIVQVTRTIEDGKEKEETGELVEHLLLTRRELDQVRALANAAPSASPAAVVTG